MTFCSLFNVTRRLRCLTISDTHEAITIGENSMINCQPLPKITLYCDLCIHSRPTAWTTTTIKRREKCYYYFLERYKPWMETTFGFLKTEREILDYQTENNSAQRIIKFSARNRSSSTAWLVYLYPKLCRKQQ